jgi:hypothetical protein
MLAQYSCNERFSRQPFTPLFCRQLDELHQQINELTR